MLSGAFSKGMKFEEPVFKNAIELSNSKESIVLNCEDIQESYTLNIPSKKPNQGDFLIVSERGKLEWRENSDALYKLQDCDVSPEEGNILIFKEGKWRSLEIDLNGEDGGVLVFDENKWKRMNDYRLFKIQNSEELFKFKTETNKVYMIKCKIFKLNNDAQYKYTEIEGIFQNFRGGLVGHKTPKISNVEGTLRKEINYRLYHEGEHIILKDNLRCDDEEYGGVIEVISI